MEHTHQEQDQYDSFFPDDGIDWASIPLPDARPDQIVVEDSQTVDGNGSANLKDAVIAPPSSESIAASSSTPISRSGGGAVGGLDGIPTMGVGMQVDSVDINVGVGSDSRKDDAAEGTAGNGIGDGDGGYVSHSMMDLDGRVEQQSLRDRLENLQKTLEQKDAALFDLESTVVALEAETTSRIQKSEHDSANKVKAAQDQLRRMQQELDSKNLSLAKIRKRRKGEERQKQQDLKQLAAQHTANANANAVEEGHSTGIETNSMTWRSPLDKHRQQPQSVEIRATPTSTNQIPTPPPATHHGTNINSSRDIFATSDASTPIFIPATTPISIAESKDTTPQKTSPSSFQTSHISKSTIRDTKSIRRQQLASHLLLYCDTIETGIMPTLCKSASIDSSSPYHVNHNSSSIDPTVTAINTSSSCSQIYMEEEGKQKQYNKIREWDELKKDQCRIRSLLESMAILSPLPIPSTATSTEKESMSEFTSQTDTNGGGGSNKISQIFGMEDFVRELICMFVAKFPPHHKPGSAPAAVVKQVSKVVDTGEKNTDDAISHTDLPTNNNGDNTKNRTSTPVPPQSHHHRGTVSWLSVEFILSMLHQICFQSTEARSSVQRWICQSCSSSNAPIMKSAHSTTSDDVYEPSVFPKKNEKKRNGGDDLTPSFATPHRTLSRIRGISSKQSTLRIISATLNMKDVLAMGAGIDVGGEDLDSLHGRGDIIWDAQHRNMICQKFVKILSSLIVGKNKVQWKEISLSSSSYKRQRIPSLVQMKSMALLQVWLNGCPQERTDADNYPPPLTAYEEQNSWIIWMNHLLVPWSTKLECGNNDKFESSNFHWIDLISVIEIQSTIPGTRPVGRRQYLQWTEGEEKDASDEEPGKFSRAEDSCAVAMQNESIQGMCVDALPPNSHHKYKNAHPSLINESSDFPTKCSVIQLVEKLICSSSCVRRLLFNNTLYRENPNLRKGVTGARRIVASILDDLQGLILPYMSTYSKLLRNDECNNDERVLMESILFLCINETRLIATMCESVSCYTLMRTLMKVRSVGEAENGDSEAGVAIMIDVLECCVRVLIRDEHDVEMGKSEISHQWNSIVNNILSFLHLVSCHTQECVSNTRSERKYKADHTSFTSIISGVNRINALCSSCIMIADSEVIAGYCCFEYETLHQAKLILHDLIEVD